MTVHCTLYCVVGDEVTHSTPIEMVGAFGSRHTEENLHSGQQVVIISSHWHGFSMDSIHRTHKRGNFYWAIIELAFSIVLPRVAPCSVP